ncbi:MAG: cadmium-translocating P-type ATPase [Candidatus Gastranaerophilales bacterium]|nr:cadmium-translocating P-type ATPase [Candidatus Gastranaerophilales bacterium]
MNSYSIEVKIIMCNHCCEHSNHHSEEVNGHEHEHNHGSGAGINNLYRAGIAAVIVAVLMLLSTDKILNFVLYLAAYLIAGVDVAASAVKNILKGNFFDENFLMSIAVIGAFCIGEYPEAVSVMVLYQIGEFLQHKAVDKSRKSISELMDIRPEYANIEEDGILIQKNPEEIAVNDVIVVKAGEKIPLDGTVKEGSSFIDTSSLTGESTLKEVKRGDEVLSGSVNKNGVLKIIVNKLYKDSAVSKILELVENAASKKSKTESFITKFAKFYTPIVVICAVLIVLIPLIFTGVQNVNIWIERALTFLVISCPCALVISVPLTFFSGIGAASRLGILIKGSSYIEKLASPDCVVFDKTGTLTNGSFKVTDIIPEGGTSKEELLEIAAYAESYSNHPIALSVKEAYGILTDNSRISNAVEIEGSGVKAEIDGNIVLAGNKKLTDKFNISVPVDEENGGTAVYIVKNNVYTGKLIISDGIKSEAYQTISSLQRINIKTVMLTGDSIQNAREAAEKLKIDKYYASLLPKEKVKKTEELMDIKPRGKSIIFVGDGINDAPVLMRSDIGIAMGALGSDAAIEAADVVITDDNPLKIYTAIRISKRTIQIANQNIIFAIGIKLLFLVLGGLGLMTMWGAVFSDVGVTLIAVLNSLRNLKVVKE